MKSVRIASTVKYIEESDDRVTLFRIQEILSEYRTTLISGLLSDLPSYIQFKFYTKVSKEVQGILTEKLLELSSAKVNLDRYASIVREIEKNNNYRVPCEMFFKEIDSLLDAAINPQQLKLVR